MKRILCPVCRKKLHWDFNTKEWHCPRKKINQEKKVGCGYIHSEVRGFEFRTFVTEKEKEDIIKSLGGKTK